MADEVSTGELGRRLDEVLRRLDDLVSRHEYITDQKHIDRRFDELARNLEQERIARLTSVAEERTAREKAVQELKDEDIKDLKDANQQRAAQRGTDWRQVLFQGLIPTLVVLVTFLFQILRGS